MVVSFLDGGTFWELWSLLRLLLSPHESQQHTMDTITSRSIFKYPIRVRCSTRKLHSPCTCPEEQPCLSTSHPGTGQSPRWWLASWGDEQFSPEEPPEPAGDDGGNGILSACIPIKMRDCGPCLGQDVPGSCALDSVGLSRDCFISTPLSKQFLQQRS